MPDGSKKGLLSRARGVVFGPPKDVHDAHTFHSISLVAMLAWVGLGADGLSSSAYGPAEAFKELLKHDDHTSLAVGLALGTALTVFIISYGYSRIIEQFPSGGGGYVVGHQAAREQLGRRLRLGAPRRLRAHHHHQHRGRWRRHLRPGEARMARGDPHPRRGRPARRLHPARRRHAPSPRRRHLARSRAGGSRSASRSR